MSFTMHPAAPQQTQSSPPVRGAGAFDHLAPVVDQLARSLALPKYQQAAGARRWQMKLALVAGRTYAGLKSLLAMVGVAAVCGFFALPMARQDWTSTLGPDSLWEPAKVV